MNKKNIICIVLIGIILALVIYNINNDKNVKKNEIEEKQNIIISEYVEILEDGTLKNNSEELKKNKIFEGLELTRILITGKYDETVQIVFDIKNTTKITKGNKEVTLVMKDKKENEIGRIGLHINEIEAEESITMELTTEKTFINTYDFEILDKKLTLE